MPDYSKSLTERVAALERKMQVSAAPIPNPIPMLPEHPRFKYLHPDQPSDDLKILCFEIGVGMGLGHASWSPILTLGIDRLEECCAIARCWWADQYDRTRGNDDEERDQMLKNTLAWRDYYEARRKS